MKNKLIIIVVSILFKQLGYAQQILNTDSLIASFAKKDNKEELNNLLNHIDTLKNNKYDEIEVTANWVIEKASKKNYYEEEATAYNILGNANLALKKMKEALICYQKAIVIGEKYDATKELSRGYIGMYNYNKENSDISQSLFYAKKNLEYCTKKNYLIGIAKSKYGIGANLEDYGYPNTKDTFNLSLGLMNEAVAIWMQLKDTAQAHRCFIGIAELLASYELYDTALKTLQAHEETLTTVLNRKFAAPYYFTLGKIYNQKAGSLKEDKAIHGLAIESFKKSLQYANEQKNYKYMLWSLNWLSKSYSYIKDFENAFQTKKRYSNLNDSLLDGEYLQSMASTQHKLDEAKKQNEITKLSSRNKILIGSILSLSLIGFLGYRNFRSKQKLQHQKITELEKEKQLAAIDNLLQGQEEERSRLAKDLHDGLGGMLSGVKLSFNNMKETLVLTPENVVLFESSLKRLDASIIELRKVSHNLMPDVLLKFGLTEALQDYCNSLNASTNQTSITFQQSGITKELNNTSKLYIYRIIQELINNAIKHGDASKILAQLSFNENKTLITVDDNGKGFNPVELISSKGIGMTNVKQRVDYLKGKMDIDSQLGKGTSINIELNV